MTHIELIDICRKEFLLIEQFANAATLRVEGKAVKIRETIAFEAKSAVEYIDKHLPEATDG